MSTLESVLEGEGVRLAYLFGSRARETARPDSDIDVAILLPEGLTPLERFDRSVRLQTALEPLVGKPLDLVVLNDASPVLSYEAVIRGKPLYEGDFRERFAFEQSVCQRYEDYQFGQRFFTQARRRRLGLQVSGQPQGFPP